MRIIIYVKPDVAGLLHKRGRATKASHELKQTAQELGVELEPMHPDVDDPNLQAYFMVEVPSYEQAQEVISTLQNLSAVDGAYIKPAEEAP